MGTKNATDCPGKLSAVVSAGHKKTPPPLAHRMRWGDGVLLIVTRKEEIPLSLAGLAATYSPRA
jgi:hypothetical protein